MQKEVNTPAHSVLQPRLPTPQNPRISWGQLYGSSRGLVVTAAKQAYDGLLLLVTSDMQTAIQLQQELLFFGDAGHRDNSIIVFPDWETLPYDAFSPHEDITSERLQTLYRLPTLTRTVLIVPVTTLMLRLPPRTYLEQHSLILDTGQQLDREVMRQRLDEAGYSHVSQVMTHGEFAVRGSLIDLYPMGSRLPIRIDLFDDEIESIRLFDPEKQTSLNNIQHVRLLPAREFPTNEVAIKRFRKHYRRVFEGDPNASQIYRDVSDNTYPAGIEYYLPLFFDHTHTLFDYLPDNTLCIQTEDILTATQTFDHEVAERYEQRRHDPQRPILPPEQLYLSPEQIKLRLESLLSIGLQRHKLADPSPRTEVNYATVAPPKLVIQPRAKSPADALHHYVNGNPGRILFGAESTGRREHLLDMLHGFGVFPTLVGSWQEFLSTTASLAITIAPIEQGLHLADPEITIITEAQLLGERAQQKRRRKGPTRDADAIIRNLTDLHEDAPVVHEEHGVGRYRGLQKLQVGGVEAEFLTLEYSGGDKLYVPVSSLHLISRYTGASVENAPLHRLGGDQWQKVKRKAAAKARDVAAELLDIFARRAAKPGFAFDVDNDEYASFTATFPFEETPDQETTINDVLHDMGSSKPMDRVVCGDVGFGKTEVAMRAAFVATLSGKQVAVLVPTTLLAQQHFQNFRDRFADWPIRIESLSRLRSQKQQKAVLEGLINGQIDIVIGTHKLLQTGIKFKNLGMVIVDEEHRFGVRHKERLKDLRSELDMLTLTATPIPRTLNMSLSGLRDLSIIATPPAHRHAIKTFINQWNDSMIKEAIHREIKRSGQVYFLHNRIETIEKVADRLRKLIPSAKIRVAHGKMRESELEHVMLDFYHQRFNVLVCTTIIESGIDIPTANTMIIDRADKLGLSQLHQLRGRVGRSHHRAYAYLLTPPRSVITADAIKRLEAIESLEELGVGFTLATHDLEIRGAGELLGEEQSGQIQEIGFTLYNEFLERAVTALRSGQIPDIDAPLDHGSEVDLGVPALLPDDYVPDVHLRLILYKRIASAKSEEALRELKVETIDRFGLLPDPAQNLFEIAHLKLMVQDLGVRKVEVGSESGRILFDAKPKIDTSKLVQLIHRQPQIYRLDTEGRLRFSLPMKNIQQRISAVLSLIDILALKKAA
jgi:transcription-repair coupling factor (superfamily II helicase)